MEVLEMMVLELPEAPLYSWWRKMKSLLARGGKKQKMWKRK
jgi:hypothetical protein